MVKGFEAGGVDYVTKPLYPDEVLVRIRSHIHNAKVALSAQTALDYAGKNLFCLNTNAKGQVAWATPHVYELVEQLALEEDVPWTRLANFLQLWLVQSSKQDLPLHFFKESVKVIYEGQQNELHMLRLAQEKVARTPLNLQTSLPITKRESEVLYWVSYGKTNWEISQILEMSPRTVNKHLEQIFRKIEVDNRTAAAISIRILDVE
jgi:DNA-binding CsgD family transcriptional regulator